MGTESNKVDLYINADDIIKASLRKLGVTNKGDSPDTQDYADALFALNNLAKSLTTLGLQLWARETIKVTPVASQAKYILGGYTGGGTVEEQVVLHCSAQAAASSTSISIGDASGYDNINRGIASSDTIKVYQTDGTWHSTTVSSLTEGATTITLTDATAAIVEEGAPIVITTSNPASKPMRVLDSYRRVSGNDTKMTKLSRDEYDLLADKDQSGEPVNYLYEPKKAHGELTVWPVPDSTFVTNGTIYLTVHRQIENISAKEHSVDFPAEWYRTLVWGLAAELVDDEGVPTETRDRIIMRADQLLKESRDFDQEYNSIYLQPKGCR